MRFFARLFLPIFTVWLCLFPAASYAITIQTFAVAGKFIPVTGVSAVALDVVLGASKLNPWIGMAVTAYSMARFAQGYLDAQGNAGTLNVKPVGTQQAPAEGETWTDWTQANGVWTPPLVIPTTVSYSANAPVACAAPNTFSSLAGVITCLNTNMASAAPWFEQIPNIAPYPGISLGCRTTQLNCGSAASSSPCPAGYVAAGLGYCNLSNAAAVLFPSDGKPTVYAKTDGTGFALDLRDPDIAVGFTAPTSIVSSGNVSGSPVRITVSPVSGGGYQVKTEHQTLGSDGTTTTYRQTATISSTGQMTDVTGGTYPGSISQQTGTTGVLAPTAPSVQFPTDYNREVTQNLIKSDTTAMKTSLENIQANTDPAEVPLDLPSSAVTTWEEARASRDLFVSSISNAPEIVSGVSLLNPFSTSECAPLSYTFGGVMTAGSHVVTLDLCPWVPTIKRIGAWAMYLLTAGMLFQMFTRRPEGGN